MRRVAVVLVAALLATIAGSARAAEKPLLLKPVIPPALAELEAKADALQITSARVSVSTSLHLEKEPKGLRKLAKLLEIEIEGVETVSPPAATVSAKLFGAQLRLRYVGGHVYLFEWMLGKHDGGRPWVQLGHGAVGRELGNIGKQPSTTPVSGTARFGKVFTLVNGGIGLHEVAPATLYGQPVIGFEEEIEQKAASEGISSSGVTKGLAASKAPAPAKPKLTIYLAASGAPVRVQIARGTSHVGFTLTIDFPAIDFPYTISAPPPAHVITERALLKRFPPHRSSQSFEIASPGAGRK